MNAPREDVRAWVRKAEEDFQIALALSRRRQKLTGGICFHAQQCAEKYLKAFLVQEKVAFPKTHDLLRLLQLCQRRDALLQSLHPFLEFLNAYSVLVRYPGEEPTLDEAKNAVKAMREIRQVLRQRLGLQNRSG
jgi:HEPN domain-containing protein